MSTKKAKKAQALSGVCGASALPPGNAAYFKGSGHEGPRAHYSDQDGVHRCTRPAGHDGLHTKKEYGMVLGEEIDNDGNLVRHLFTSYYYWQDENELHARVGVTKKVYQCVTPEKRLTLQLQKSARSTSAA